MSRSGYTDDCDNIAMWRGQVASAMRGKRGQRMFVELLAALDAMPEKKLIAHELEEDGAYCALGVLGKARGIDMSKLAPDEPDDVAAAFDVAQQLAREVVYMNDEWIGEHEDPEKRWARMRKWVAEQIKQPPEIENASK